MAAVTAVLLRASGMVVAGSLGVLGHDLLHPLDERPHLAGAVPAKASGSATSAELGSIEGYHGSAASLASRSAPVSSP